jgi:hypothetical protein
MSGKQFSNEEWEAAMSAKRASSSGHASNHGGHDEPPPGMSDATAAWYKRTFPVHSLPVDPAIHEELPRRQRGQTVDLNAFCQGNVGDADQRYLRQQEHAYEMGRDPNVEVYRDQMAAAQSHRSRRKGYFPEDENESRGSGNSRALTLFQWLRLLLLAALTTCAILFVSFHLLPSTEGSMTSVMWFGQVFCIHVVGMYLASIYGGC